MKNNTQITFGRLKQIVSEALWNLDHEDDEELNAIIDEYNRLEDEVRKVLRQFPNGPYNFDSRAYKLESKLNRLGVWPGGFLTKDGYTGDDYAMTRQAQDKYQSDPEFRQEIDDLKAEFEKEKDAAMKNYQDTLRPYIRALNKYHNEHWREIVRRGEDIWPRRNVPIDSWDLI